MLKYMKKCVAVFLAGVIFVTGSGSSTTYAGGLLGEGSRNTVGLYVQVVPQDSFMEEVEEENTTGVPLHHDVIKSKFISKELENILQIAAVDKEKQKAIEMQQQLEREKAAKEKAAKKAKEEAAAKEKEEKEKEEKEKIFCGYTNIGIADVAASNFVNIRKSPSSDSEKVGKLKGDAICQVIKKTENDWYKIKSGDVKGYVSAEFILVGQEAEDRALSLAVTRAEVNADVLVVRQKASKDSEAIAKVAQGHSFRVVEEKTKGDWVAISYNNTTGYVFADFVDLKETTLSTAEAIQQRQVERAQEQKQEREVSTQITQNNNFKKEKVNKEKLKLKNTKATDAQKEVVEYALKFVGNPYAWGGTSLTKGADCSGFTQSVYAHFGYYLNRTSRDQSQNGTPVDLDEIQPGDLLFYSYGGVIGHVAIYIGDNKIVHASTEETGIIVSNAFRSTPCCAVRILEEDEVEIEQLSIAEDDESEKDASAKKASDKDKTKKKEKKETKKSSSKKETKTNEQAKTEEKDEEKDK